MVLKQKLYNLRIDHTAGQDSRYRGEGYGNGIVSYKQRGPRIKTFRCVLRELLTPNGNCNIRAKITPRIND